MIFIVNSRNLDRLEKQIADGLHPLPDYLAYVRRFRPTLFTLDDLYSTDRVLADALAERGSLTWGMIGAVDPHTPTEVMTTGEDVGIPLAIDSAQHTSTRQIFIITHGSVFRSERRAMRIVEKLDHVYFLCLSQAIRSTLLERYRIDEARAINTSYGVDTEFFSPKDGPSSPFIIASVGTANRDYSTLLRAVAPLPLDVEIAADSEWFREALDIDRCSLPPRVKIASYTYVDLRALYSRALFVVVPLYPAHFACGYSAILEAMAMGRAVIATWTSGYNDFLVHEETGYYVRPGDPFELRQRIRYLLDNPEVAVEMGRKARLIAQRFSNVQYCQKLHKSISSNPILGSRR